MKFCTKCNSMYIIKNKEKNNLVYYCNRCNTYGDPVEKVCINVTNKTDTYLTQEIRRNPYIIKDPSLPRLNNIPCKNKYCVSNTPEVDNLLLLYGISLSTTNPDTLEKIIIENLKKKIPKISPDIKLIVRPDLKCGDKKILIESTPTIPIDGSISLNLKIDDNEYPCEIKNYVHNREVVFVNYDKVNMYYLYICCNCNNSWTNNIMN